MTLKGDVWPESWNEEEFQANEDRFIDRFAKHVSDPRFQTACRRMEGAVMWVQPAYIWTDKLGRDVAGLTSCVERRMEVGYLPMVELTSMGHEYAHLVQDCVAFWAADTRVSTLEIDRGQDPMHANWVRDRIHFASGVGSL